MCECSCLVKLFRSKSNCNFDTEGQEEAGTQGEEQALVGIASVDGDPALQKHTLFPFSLRRLRT